MLFTLSKRMLTTTDPKVMWKFAYNFGYKGMRSVQKFKKRIKKGDYFPPFLYISVINSCNLRCQGCWVKVDGPRHYLDAGKMDRIIGDAKKQGNAFFGLLGGEPFMHPELLEIVRRHPDCYFQIFTNGQLITDKIAAEMRKLGNITPLVSIEGTEIISNERRGRLNVLNRTLSGLEACIRNRLITGVATSVCQTNIDDLVQESWVDRLIEMGAHYVWYHTYRPVGADPHPELALSPDQVLRIRKFIVHLRNTKPIGVIDAYWDDKGGALCPMATGISHHINPWGEIEPCPIIQFAKETVHDERNLLHVFKDSEYLADFRKAAAQSTQGCIVLERPDIVKALVLKHGAKDTTHREPGAGMAEIEAMTPRNSQHNPGNEVPEENFIYRFAKKHYFFGFGAYG
ncbi:radical SAM/SPASM domain-containing protein [Humisphaera borealis]|uniref:Radical SAM protein n=1 Tax=Humisphaera borealis TaxID=2807512 RepID=A0A7M2WUY9_9BACT|nr:radical SAM protein [Humisphaera borealis]QOV88641.1 radical SAM protein [Humisphaera borealis]